MIAPRLYRLALCAALVATDAIIFAAPAAAQTCAGDCNGARSVTVDELVTGVSIALGALPLEQCPLFDCDGFARVTVDCLIKAVDAAVNGCASEPTSSPTHIPPATPTPTATQNSTPSGTPPLTPTQPGDHFMDNGDGTITDTQSGLMWDKKDESGGLQDAKTQFPWAGLCTDNRGIPCNGADCEPCQPDAAAAATCNAATGGAAGCAECGGTATCMTINGLTTIWQWLNRI